MLIEIYSRKPLLRKRQWYFRIKGENGEIVAQSEGYKNRTDCISTVHLLKRELAGARLKLLEESA